MSHTVSVKDVKITNLKALHAAGKRIGVEVRKITSPVKLYQSKKYTEGHTVKLEGWRNPVIVEPNGDVQFDNFNGMWGNQDQLDDFLQAYSTEEVIARAEENGWLVNEVGVDKETGEVVLELDEPGF